MSPASRALRFGVEFFLATFVPGQVVVALIRTSASTSPGSTAGWVPVIYIVEAIAQWLVLRRYVPWAQWWAPATLLGELCFPSAVATPVFRTAMALSGSQVFSQSIVTSVAMMAVAAAQYPTLRGRVDRAFAWLLAAPIGALLFEMLVITVLSPATGLTMQSAMQYAPLRGLMTAIAQAAVLTWLLRPYFVETVKPAPRPFTPLEFLIAWSAAPAFAYGVLANADSAGRGRPDVALMVLPVLFISVLAAVQLWVLASAPVDQGRWRTATIASSILFAVINLAFGIPVLGYLVYMIIVLSRGGGIGLGPALGQTFAMTTAAGRTAWLAASIVGWTAGWWIPNGIHALVGGGNSYRYEAWSSPSTLGIIVGIVTGFALLTELDFTPRVEPSRAARRL